MRLNAMGGIYLRCKNKSHWRNELFTLRLNPLNLYVVSTPNATTS
jgi:hypothetical protein